MPRRRDLDSQSWRERRWQEIPSVSDDNFSPIGDWLFAAARDAGQTPALVEASFYPFQGWDDEWRLTRQAVSGLRDALPPDCFPFRTHARSSYFVTTAVGSPEALCRLLAHVQRTYDAAPVINDKGEPVELELTGWFVDDDKDFDALTSGSGPTGMLSTSFEVISARHLCEGRWSQAGLIERLIPAMRERVGESGSLTLVGVKPIGLAWAQYLGEPELYEIELHIEFTFKKPVEEARGALAYLCPPRHTPTQTSFPQMLLLPLDERASRSLIEPIVGELDAKSYWGRDMDYQSSVELAKPGEIRIAAAFLSLAPETDAAAACASIEQELA